MPTPPSSASPDNAALAAAMLFAVAAPVLIPFDLPPSATVLNQAVAWVGWGIVGWLLTRRAPRQTVLSPGVVSVGFALLLVGLGAAVATPLHGLPPGMSLSVGASVLAAAALMLAAAQSTGDESTAGRESTKSVLQALCLALLLTGLLSSLLAILQIFAPTSLDGAWLAPAGGGRAAGNLRQPNHLATLLLWSCAAAVLALLAPERTRAVKGAGGLLMLTYVFGIVLTASRTGALGVLLMAAWGAVDRRLTRTARIVLIGMPVAYIVMWLVLTYADASPASSGFVGMDRMRQADPTSSRFAIWSNAVALVRADPWAGVGVGNFNFAWTLTPFPGRPVEFFDHAHNLVLQLVAEMGLPLGGATVLLLLGGLFWSLRTAARSTSPDASSRRPLFVMLLVMALHSQFEYPLWYAYFLFPTAILAGLQLGSSERPGHGASRRWALAAACLAVAIGGLVMLWDYRGVSTIFVATDGVAPLEQRIADGQRSLLFGHHADYARVTAMKHPPLDQFERPVHYLLDVRLMTAWAEALADAGLLDHARHVAQRLREFERDEAQAFFKPCDEPRVGSPPPFQCEAPSRRLTPDDFR